MNLLSSLRILRDLVGISFSGGGNKITYLLGVGYYLLYILRVRVDFFLGVSAGAILSFFFAISHTHPELLMKGIDKIKEFETHDILKEKKGFFRKFVVFYRFTSKIHLYSDINLEKTIRSMITKKMFQRWQEDFDAPTAIVSIIDPETSGKEEETNLLVNLKEVDYDTAIKAVMASTTIPPFVRPKKVFKSVSRWFVDGGLENHNASAELIERVGVERFDTLYSVYSRVEDRHQLNIKMPKEGFLKFPIIKWTLSLYEILLFVSSKKDEEMTDNLLKPKGKNHYKIFAPKRLVEDPYTMSPEQNRKLYNLGMAEAEKQMGYQL